MSAKLRPWTEERLKKAVAENCGDSDDDDFALDESRDAYGRRTRRLPVCGRCLDTIEAARMAEHEGMLKPAGEGRPQMMVDQEKWSYNMIKRAMVDNLERYFSVTGEPTCNWFFHVTGGVPAANERYHPMVLLKEYERYERAAGNNTEMRDEYLAALRTVADKELHASQALLSVEMSKVPAEVRERPFDASEFEK